MMTRTSTTDLQRSIVNCLECHRSCIETAAHCLDMGGRHAEPPHIRMLLDCSEICQVAADFLTRRSELYGRVCAVCAMVCERCADSCDRFGDDEQVRTCAEVCRRCAESCHDMAGP